MDRVDGQYGYGIDQPGPKKFDQVIFLAGPHLVPKQRSTSLSCSATITNNHDLHRDCSRREWIVLSLKQTCKRTNSSLRCNMTIVKIQVPYLLFISTHLILFYMIYTKSTADVVVEYTSAWKAHTLVVSPVDYQKADWPAG